MAKINVDITTKVDISCREGDSFELNIDVTNVGGSSFDFTDKTVLFAIYDARKQPVKICSNNHIFPKLTDNRGFTHVNDVNKKFARGLISLYNTLPDLFNFVYEDSLEYIYPSINDNAATDFIDPRPIRITNNSMQIIIPSVHFNIPFGVYSYDVKLVSDLEDVLHATDAVSESKYKNSTTWMEGKFTVNKN
jgi:hypothetical protein